MATRKYWLQLPQTYFNRLPQRKMRKQPDGEIMQIIYLKMLLACIGNSGLILYQGVYDSLAEEIAEEIDEETEIVQKTIDYIIKNNMAREIEDKDGGGYFFPESDEFTGSESESAERMRRMRKKAKASQCDRSVTKSDSDVTDGDDNKVKNNKEDVKKNIIDSSLHLKGETLPPSAGAGGASPFTLTDCEECADEGKVNLSEDGIRAFYNRMEKDGWEIKGTPVTNLLKAMRGFAKHHKEYQQPEEEKTEQSSVSTNERPGDIEICKSIMGKIIDYLPNNDTRNWQKKIVKYCERSMFTDQELELLARRTKVNVDSWTWEGE